MKIFEVAVVFHPTEAGREKGEKDKIVVDVQRVLAKDLNHANILASRLIPEEYADRIDCLEVAVRTF